jgi:hypothetical protein
MKSQRGFVVDSHRSVSDVFRIGVNLRKVTYRMVTYPPGDLPPRLPQVTMQQ